MKPRKESVNLKRVNRNYGNCNTQRKRKKEKRTEHLRTKGQFQMWTKKCSVIKPTNPGTASKLTG